MMKIKILLIIITIVLTNTIIIKPIYAIQTCTTTKTSADCGGGETGKLNGPICILSILGYTGCTGSFPCTGGAYYSGCCRAGGDCSQNNDGNEGQPCKPGGVCNGALTCCAVTNNTCQQPANCSATNICGNHNQEACATGTPCRSTSDTKCNIPQHINVGKCVGPGDCTPFVSACGKSGGPCCTAGPACTETGLVCKSNKCINPNINPTDPHLVLLPTFGGKTIELAAILAAVGGILYPLGIGIGLFFIVRAGYMYMTSEGEPQRVKVAQEDLTAAILGIIFILLSVGIMNIIINSIIKG